MVGVRLALLTAFYLAVLAAGSRANMSKAAETATLWLAIPVAAMLCLSTRTPPEPTTRSFEMVAPGRARQTEAETR